MIFVYLIKVNLYFMKLLDLLLINMDNLIMIIFIDNIMVMMYQTIYILLLIITFIGSIE